MKVTRSVNEGRLAGIALAHASGSLKQFNFERSTMVRHLLVNDG